MGNILRKINQRKFDKKEQWKNKPPPKLHVDDIADMGKDSGRGNVLPLCKPHCSSDSGVGSCFSEGGRSNMLLGSSGEWQFNWWPTSFRSTNLKKIFVARNCLILCCLLEETAYFVQLLKQCFVQEKNNMACWNVNYKTEEIHICVSSSNTQYENNCLITCSI